MIYERMFRKQTPTYVNDSPNKHTIGDKTTPLGHQKVRPKNKQLKVTWLQYLVVPFGMGKCKSQHVLLNLEE
jgi:hypothetical protein